MDKMVATTNSDTLKKVADGLRTIADVIERASVVEMCQFKTTPDYVPNCDEHGNGILEWNNLEFKMRYRLI